MEATNKPTRKGPRPMTPQEKQILGVFKAWMGNPESIDRLRNLVSGMVDYEIAYRLKSIREQKSQTQ